jgi:hypothetical protein
MKKLTLALVILLGTVPGVSAMDVDTSEIPKWVLDVAVDCLVDRVGEDFFIVTMGYQKIERLSRGLGYYVHFEFRLPGRPWAERDFVVRVDASRSCRDSVRWLPDLRNNPTICAFCVSPEDAKRIAREAGLELGIADWIVSQSWHDGSFLWRVENRMTETSMMVPTPYIRQDGSREKSVVTSWRGWAMLVDPHNGDVIDKLWYEAN